MSKFIVTGRSKSHGQTLFLCSSATQGWRFVPWAHSMAHRFNRRTEAIDAAVALAPEWKGLTLKTEVA